jgi:asparagine synthase (glutamine-hydrolysing)
MSSIFGKIHLEQKPVTTDGLHLMLNELNHWNTDDANVWVSGAAGLGHLMLHNTPESLHEKLPLHDVVTGLCITADARIDNRGELYPHLQMSSPTEKFLPDSSMLIRLYKKYGGDCVKYLVGDFAFAIWDEQEQKLFCARDQMGVKPFFYYSDDHFFAFATEKKGLLCIPGINKVIDKQFFYNQVMWPPVQAADATLYKHIKRLPPAHSLTFYPAEKKLQLHNYWTLDPYKETKLARKEDYYEGLRNHFETAVQCRLRTHYPIGAELSGGLDSSAITGAANHFLKSEGRGIISFSNTDNGDPEAIKLFRGENERKYIEAAIKFNSIEDYEFLTKDIWDDPLDEVDFSLKVNDGLEMWNLLWLLPIKNAAMQRGVRTLLSGFPGDEMVTYRGQFYFLDHLDNKEYTKYFSAKTEKGFKKIKPFITPGMEFGLHKMRNILTINDRHIKQAAAFYPIPAKYRLAKGDLAWKDPHYLERFKSHRHYQKYRLLKPQVALRMEAETRYGISFKTEPRFPMADIRLTQFYLSMPNDIKCEGEMSRSAYRLAIQKYLPDMILQRDAKSGNIAPFRNIQESVNKRQQSMHKLLNAIGNRHTNINKNIAYAPNNESKLIRYLEILRWVEKNSEKIMK